ncbi:GGDEF domain-containing protein [Vibrio penaeicida]|uniref:GGDEF domain-containing protein n=1 Tax=Vibrio penaeicida TaxID=104609 RepID=UPI000CEA6754|nr:GGDEF domain-containing protein [Vibrio penaeicida]
MSQHKEIENFRERVFIRLSTVLGMVCIPLAILNYVLKDYALFTFQVAYSIIALITRFKFDVSSNKKNIIRAHTLMFSVVILYATVTKPVEEGVFQWTICLPPIYYFLLGKKEGSFSSGFYLAITIVALLFYWDNTLSITIVNFVFAYALSASICFTYECKRNNHQVHWEKLAHFDFLTGALNRRALDCYMIGNENTNAHAPAIICFDIDNFKHINDNFGHDGGDKVLIDITKRLQRFCGSDSVYRIGGEEFVITLSKELVEYSGSVKTAVESIMRCISVNPILHNHEHIYTTVSGGVITSQTYDAQMWAELDENLYLAKNEGKSRIYKDKSLFCHFK